jgi:hypothetical protein
MSKQENGRNPCPPITVKQSYFANLGCSFWGCYKRERETCVFEILYSELSIHKLGIYPNNLIIKYNSLDHRNLGWRAQRQDFSTWLFSSC